MIETVAAHEILMPLTEIPDFFFRSKIVCFVDTLTGEEKIVYGRNRCPRGILPADFDIPILMIELDFDSPEEAEMLRYLRMMRNPWQKWR